MREMEGEEEAEVGTTSFLQLNSNLLETGDEDESDSDNEGYFGDVMKIQIA